MAYPGPENCWAILTALVLTYFWPYMEFIIGLYNPDNDDNKRALA